MKRRGFITGLLGAAPAAVAMAVGVKSELQTMKYTLHCAACNKDYEDSVPLQGPIFKTSPQCSQCLQVLPFPSDLHEKIFTAQGRDKYGRPR